MIINLRLRSRVQFNAPDLADANTTSSVSGVLSESGGFAVGSLLGEHSLMKMV